MKTMSAIYQKVRHRITDDWAYGNDLDARPWDFQAEEFALQVSYSVYTWTFTKLTFNQIPIGQYKSLPF